MTGLLQDLRYALRQFGRNPGFTSVAVLTLALGIAANTTIFSVLDAVLLRPLPFPDSDRLVVLWGVNLSRGWADNPIEPRWFVEWHKQNHVFADMAAFEPISLNLSGSGKPEEVAAERTTPNLFSLLGVKPMLGRGFISAESRADSRTAVLSYRLWQGRFGSDRQVAGKQILLNGDSYTVVGVLPSDFSHRYTSPAFPSPQVWVAGFDPESIPGDEKGYGAIARLKSGVTLLQAQTEMDTIARRVEQQYPDDKGWGVALFKAQDKSVEYTRSALLVLWVAVSLVLLIACANLASLLLARAEARSREIGLRAVLGASRQRLLRQLLTESSLLAFLGAGAGLLLALSSTPAILTVTPPVLLQAVPGLEDAGVNLRVLGYCSLLATGTGLLIGLLPALSRSRGNLNQSLNESGKGSTQGRQRHRMRAFLVISEFSLALMLLVGAGLMIRTLIVLNKLDLGFDRNHVLTMKLPLLGPHFKDTPQRVEFLRQLSARLNQLPGVRSASVTRGVPIEDWSGWDFVTEEDPNPAAEQIPDANYNIIGPHYFATLGVPLQRGRDFTGEDSETSPPVVVVSEQLARNSWPGQNPIGKRIRIVDSAKANAPWRVVIGVAANVLTQGPDSGFHPELYIPYTQAPWLARVSLAVRTSSDPASITPAVRQEIARLDKDLPVSEIKTLAQVAGEPVAQRRLVMALLVAFASLALVLAAAGIYSVTSYMVMSRTREIGLRMAMGARPGQVVRMVLRQGLRLALLGAAAGLASALALTRFLASQLFGVAATDFATFTWVTLFLLTIMLFACYIPARRAAGIDPMTALRYE
jgi:putative ABC transport system permease protein